MTSEEPGRRQAGSLDTQAALNLVPIPCAILNDVGDVIAANAAWRSVPSPLLVETGQNLLETLGRAAQSQRAAGVLRDVLGKRSESSTIEIASAGDAGVRWFRVTAAAREPAGATVVLIDITDHLVTESSLRRSEHRFRQMVDLVQDHAIYTLDERGLIMTWSTGAQRLYGYTTTEIVGKHFETFFAPDDRGAGVPRQLLDSAARSGRCEVEGWRVRKNGSRFWAYAIITSLSEQDGQVLGYSCMSRDLTDLRRSEGALRDTEVRLSGIIDSAMDAIITIDDAQRIVLFNHAAERIFGVPAGEAIGGSLDRFLPMKFREAHSSHIRSFGKTGVTTRAMGRLATLYGLRAGGKEFPIEASISQTTSAGQKFYTVILRDVSERRALEEQLLQSQKMEGIGRLAGGVAHDFNNLLTVLFGYLAAASSTVEADHAAQGYLTRAREAAEKAASLTRQLLAFARKQMVTPRRVRISEIVAALEPMLRRLLGEDMVLRTVISPTSGAVMADAGQIEQVLMNLSVNARDAMPRGGTLTIEVQNVVLDEAYCKTRVGATPGEHVMLAVTDTGVGMTPEIMERLFEPFFTTKGPGKGTGLGLATCHGIIRQFGGHIAVYSEPGRGTTIRVFLPRLANGADAPSQVAAIPAPRGGTETVLLVEDNEMVRTLVEHGLQASGYKVVTAPNGPGALEMLSGSKLPIQLLITDVVMPEMSGVQLTEELNRRGIQVPVVYMSGYTEDTVVYHGVETATTTFLSKPFTVVEMLTKIRAVLDSQGRATKW